MSESELWPAFVQVYNYGKTVATKIPKLSTKEEESPKEPELKEGEIILKGKDGKTTKARRYADETHIITEFPDGWKIYQLK